MMNDMAISFPNLGIDLSYVPKTFNIFGIPIAFYGVIIAIGFIAGFSLANREANRLGYEKDMLWDFAVMAIMISLIGARAYYVIFSWDYYKQNPIEILNFREGGLAIYGGVIGGVIAMVMFCKWKKLRFVEIMDVAVMGLVTGQIIGRWGNFTNREVFGEYTNNLFAMRLPVSMVRKRDLSESILSHMQPGTNYIQVHPTFLYESVLNLLLLIIILLYRKHKKFNGEIALMYFGGYGIIRFFVEGIRTDQLKIGSSGVAVSQMLGLTLFIAALVTEIVTLVVINPKKKSKNTSNIAE